MRRLIRFEVTFLNGGESCTDYWFAESESECRRVALKSYRQDYGDSVRVTNIVKSKIQ